MGDRHDYVALEWVKGEIAETLKQARQALEAFVENPQDPTRMRFCLTYVHQVQGTLQMVEFYGAAPARRGNGAVGPGLAGRSRAEPGRGPGSADAGDPATAGLPRPDPDRPARPADGGPAAAQRPARRARRSCSRKPACSRPTCRSASRNWTARPSRNCAPTNSAACCASCARPSRWPWSACCATRTWPLASATWRVSMRAWRACAARHRWGRCGASLPAWSRAWPTVAWSTAPRCAPCCASSTANSSAWSSRAPTA